MDQIFRQVLLLTCLTIIMSVEGQDCIYQRCDCVDTSIICQEREFISLPLLLNTSGPSVYKTLNLNVNAIYEIPAGGLPPNLTNIYLEENPISVIDDAAFDDSAYTLESLSFSSAQMTKIPDAFRHLYTLKSLTIQNTIIDDWNSEAMEHIGQTLETLDLENVGMTTWPDWIARFSRLKSLMLTGGIISSIPDNSLDNITATLTSLSLYGNNLSSIPKALSNLTALQTLYIQDNNIVDVSWLPPAKSLSRLSLCNNKITDAEVLSDRILSFGSSLTFFDVHSNQLTSIPYFESLVNLDTVDISHNNILYSSSGYVPQSVSSIDLSYNYLTDIPRVMSQLTNVVALNLLSNSIIYIFGEDFPPMTSRVELGFNKIEELIDTSFPENYRIESLHLNNNPLIRISSSAFANLNKLTELNLQNTKLTRLPIAMGTLASLYMLDLSGSSNLICTCMESSLKDVILRMPEVNVIGDCGQMSIYQFFSQMSPNCPH